MHTSDGYRMRLIHAVADVCVSPVKTEEVHSLIHAGSRRRCYVYVMLYTYIYNVYITTYLLKMQTYVSRMRATRAHKCMLYICMYVCVYIYILHTCIYKYICMHTYVLHVIYICMNIFYIYTCIYIYISCIYICTCIYTYPTYLIYLLRMLT
jgi:hypothetical protein